MASDSVAILQLMQTKGLGPRALAKVLSSLDEEQETLAQVLELDPSELASRLALQLDVAHSIQANRELAEDLEQRLAEQRIQVIRRSHRAYPVRLQEVLGDKSPPVLFVHGNPAVFGRLAVGFCGARDASAQGLRCADQAATALVRHDVLVVSGNAAGVDEAAHRAALEAGGTTALVLPEGILQFRSRSGLGALFTEDNFVVLSEFSPRLPWSVANAMQRNRTICGLVNALVVVEAGITGGTFAAANEALDLGIPLFVLEFPDPPASAQGNSVLLKKGGTPLPCLPDREPDLTNLLQTMQLDHPVRSRDRDQSTLFD